MAGRVTPRAEKTVSAPGRGVTVFVCDDAPGIRRTLAQILGDEGYRVEEFEDGTSVLERLSEAGGARPARSSSTSGSPTSTASPSSTRSARAATTCRS